MKPIPYKEVQRSRVIYLVISSKVKVSKSINDVKKIITSICGKGDFFGYMSILEDENYRYEAEVLEETGLLVIPHGRFYATAIKRHTNSTKFYTDNDQEYWKKEVRLLNLAYSFLRKKVAHGLIQQYKKYKLKEGSSPVINLS